MKKSIFLKTSIVLTTILTLSTSLTPLTTFAAENHSIDEQTVPASTSSDLKEQFGLTDKELNSIDKTQNFTPTADQLKQIDNLLNRNHNARIFGLDDVLELIAIVGVGYAAGHWAASEAHKRFGLSAVSYKSNRWWWRAGIAAAAGVPAAVGFDDYFYGI
ncbi:hypothetical protein [Enterococcus thailandicus]|uniref:hypothetical protein n=1 Tax=Enterococcus TaxID=1350 RepID=UPI0032E5086C